MSGSSLTSSFASTWELHSRQFLFVCLRRRGGGVSAGGGIPIVAVPEPFTVVSPTLNKS